MRRTLAVLAGLVWMSAATNAFWLGHVEKSATGQSVVNALAGSDPVRMMFACRDGNLTFTVQVAAVAEPTTMTLSVSIDGGTPQDMKIASKSYADRQLKVSISDADAADLARRAVAATTSFATSIILDGGTTKYEAKQSMTGGPKAIGAVIEACKR